MAHKKSGGSSRNGRDSNPIIIRQRGTKVNPGEGVGLGKDHTIFALVEGHVTFTRRRDNKSFVSVTPIAQAAE